VDPEPILSELDPDPASQKELQIEPCGMKRKKLFSSRNCAHFQVIKFDADQGWKKPGFFYKKTNPVGFFGFCLGFFGFFLVFGFFWVFWVFLPRRESF
jgi:hypothetical protein